SSQRDANWPTTCSPRTTAPVPGLIEQAEKCCLKPGHVNGHGWKRDRPMRDHSAAKDDHRGSTADTYPSPSGMGVVAHGHDLEQMVGSRRDTSPEPAAGVLD